MAPLIRTKLVRFLPYSIYLTTRACLVLTKVRRELVASPNCRCAVEILANNANQWFESGSCISLPFNMLR